MAVQLKSLISAIEEDLKVSILKLTNSYDELSQPSHGELFAELPRLRRHLKLESSNVTAEWNFIEFLPNLKLTLKLFVRTCLFVCE